MDALDPRLRPEASETRELAHLAYPTEIRTHDSLSQTKTRPFDDNEGNYSSASPEITDAYGVVNTPGSYKRSAQDADTNDFDDSTLDLKKSRACEACRGLKVRCEPLVSNPDGPCKRCTKSGRSCIVTQPTRKRQKKTDSRVAELEKKIDALTATLIATRSDGQGPAKKSMASPPVKNHGSVTSNRPAHLAGRNIFIGDPKSKPSEASRTANSPAAASVTQSKLPPRSDSSNSPHVPPRTQPTMQLNSEPSPVQAAATPLGAEETRGTARTKDTESGRGADYVDIISRGVLSKDRANRLWNRYNMLMVPQVPAVIFSDTTTIDELRESQPVLFLSIMAAASVDGAPGVQSDLVLELMEILARKIVVEGEKSLELVQALLVAVIWYRPPENMEELKFYQLIHMAAVMAIDLGLGRITSTNRGPSSLIPGHNLRRRRPAVDPASLECRRIWLACYFLTSNASMSLRRPSLIRWSQFASDSLELLETSPDAAPTDKYFGRLVAIHKLGEEIAAHFSADDISVPFSMSSTRIQYLMKGFERELALFTQALAPQQKRPTLMVVTNLLNLYVHEVALQHLQGVSDGFKLCNDADPFEEGGENNAPLTLTQIHAISQCVAAVEGIHAHFLSANLEDARFLPVFTYVRVVYSTVVLIRIHGAASSPQSEMSKVINAEDLKVAQRLEDLLTRFKDLVGDDKSRPVAKFLFIIVMLRSWYHKQVEASVEARGAPAGNKDSQEGAKLPARASSTAPDFAAAANTPLQLLSEVATNNQAAAPTLRKSSAPAASMTGVGGDVGNEPWFNNAVPPFQFNGALARNPSMANNGGDQMMTLAPMLNSSMGTTGSHPNGKAVNWMGDASGDLSGNYMNSVDFSDIPAGVRSAWDLTLEGFPDGGMAGIGWQDFSAMGMMGVSNDGVFGQFGGEVPGSY